MPADTAGKGTKSVGGSERTQNPNENGFDESTSQSNPAPKQIKFRRAVPQTLRASTHEYYRFYVHVLIHVDVEH